MKKLFLFIVLFLCSGFVICAESFDPDSASDWNILAEKISFAPYSPTIHDRTTGLTYTMWGNPAGLADGKLKIQTPSISFSDFNYAALLKKAGSDVSAVLRGDANNANYVNILRVLLENLGMGYNSLGTVDVGLDAQIFNFAVGVDAKFSASTYGVSAGLSNVQLSPQLDWAVSVGYGRRIFENDVLSLDLGAMVRFAYRGIFHPLSGQYVFDHRDDFKLPQIVISGFTVPIDAGVSVGFLENTLKAELTVNNINGAYHMNKYDSISDALKMRDYDSRFRDINGRIKVSTPCLLNTGVVWTPRVKVVSPMVALDLYDIIGMFKDKELFVQHLGILGAVSVASILDLRVGIDRGYLQLGAGIGYNTNKIEISYGFNEFGKRLADKPVDRLTIRCRFGWYTK